MAQSRQTCGWLAEKTAAMSAESLSLWINRGERFRNKSSNNYSDSNRTQIGAGTLTIFRVKTSSPDVGSISNNANVLEV